MAKLIYGVFMLLFAALPALDRLLCDIVGARSAPGIDA